MRERRLALAFPDECSINCGMARLCGRALKHERARAYVPEARFERTSVASTIRLDGNQAPLIFKGALDEKAFAATQRKCWPLH